jgi:hypothetical protein
MSLEVFAGDGLVVGDHVQTTGVNLLGGVAYKRGDLLKASSSVLNQAALAVAADLAGTSVAWIMPFNLTAAESTAMAASGYTTEVYAHGEFDGTKLFLSGVALTAAQIVNITGMFSLKQNIEIRRVV